MLQYRDKSQRVVLSIQEYWLNVRPKSRIRRTRTIPVSNQTTYKNTTKLRGLGHRIGGSDDIWPKDRGGRYTQGVLLVKRPRKRSSKHQTCIGRELSDEQQEGDSSKLTWSQGSGWRFDIPLEVEQSDKRKCQQRSFPYVRSTRSTRRRWDRWISTLARIA